MALSRHTSDLHPSSCADSVEDVHSNSIGASALRKATLRLIPVLGVGYGLAFMDRASVSYAALSMNQDLHFTATIYGFGAGLFFLGNAAAEVPSNLLLLRYGAKRIMASIMLVWGLVATAMMFVRTPMEFYALRMLLGLAEAGFYPGVIYYLTLWYPISMRARAASRFYIALPLSSVVMGSLTGWLMSLNGHLGLKGWQWLFLVEGLPAVFFAPMILWLLPDSPKQAKWLTREEHDWLEGQLARDGEKAHLGHEAGVLKALLSPRVWTVGLYFFFVGICAYGLTLLLPLMLREATGQSAGMVGWMIAIFSLIGAAAMLLNGIHSDRKRERALHSIVPCLVMALGYVVASFSGNTWVIVTSLAVSFIATYSLWGPALSVPMEFLAGPAAAAGIAAMNTIAICSGFIAPYWMGLMKDTFGNYNVGLVGLMLAALAAAGMMAILMRSLAKRSTVAK